MSGQDSLRLSTLRLILLTSSIPYGLTLLVRPIQHYNHYLDPSRVPQFLNVLKTVLEFKKDDICLVDLRHTELELHLLHYTLKTL